MSDTLPSLERTDVLEAIWHLECALHVFERHDSLLTAAEIQTKTVLGVLKRELEIQAMQSRTLIAGRAVG